MKRTSTRSYNSERRRQGAEETRGRILDAARRLFVRRGIDLVTIAEIAEAAGVAPPTVYSLFKSKEGILGALIRGTLFGERFQLVRSTLEGVTDPVRLIALSAHVARAIYETESVELGLVRGASVFSRALRKFEKELEQTRLDMQEERVRLLFEKRRQRKGLTVEDAQRILWMYTSREVYRMLVQESRWSPDRYQEWLSRTLLEALVERRFHPRGL